MNELLDQLNTMLKQVNNIDMPFRLQSKYLPKIDALIRELHSDIDAVTDKMIEYQEIADSIGE